MRPCMLRGHRFRFHAEGSELLWECQYGCGAGGAKRYASPADARRYAAAFDREDNADLGRRAPLLGLFPLRAFHAIRTRRGAGGHAGGGGA